MKQQLVDAARSICLAMICSTLFTGCDNQSSNSPPQVTFDDLEREAVKRFQDLSESESDVLISVVEDSGKLAVLINDIRVPTKVQHRGEYGYVLVPVAQPAEPEHPKRRLFDVGAFRMDAERTRAGEIILFFDGQRIVVTPDGVDGGSGKHLFGSGDTVK